MALWGICVGVWVRLPVSLTGNKTSDPFLVGWENGDPCGPLHNAFGPVETLVYRLGNPDGRRSPTTEVDPDSRVSSRPLSEVLGSGR